MTRLQLMALLPPAVLFGAVHGTAGSKGCFADTMHGRVMQDRLTDYSMTHQFCEDYCDENNYFYWSVQWGIECWCADEGVDLSEHGDGKCDMECGGNPDELCGGWWSFEAFEVGSSSTVPGPSPPSSELYPNLSPTPVMSIPSTCELSKPEFRWEEDSGASGRLYADGEGCFTMTDLYEFQGVYSDGKSRGPVYVLDSEDDVDLYPTTFTGKWLLTAELYVVGGGVFYCRGTDIEGDCDELRIESRGSSAFHEICGHGGSLYFENTIVTSWDTTNKEPQQAYTSGRSFIRCLSQNVVGTTCAKDDMGECRMDIINSEMGYLGYNDAESYGLTWKVRGYCEDESNPQVFDDVNVYGDIRGSDIHNMYYGMYSYGHQGGVWVDNKMHDNIQYGFDPHDDSDYLIIANNEVYNNNNHCIIASKRCNNVKIYNNDVHDGGEVGIFLHRSSDDCEVYGNTITDMDDAGFALFESFNADVYDNTVDRAKFGIRMMLGAGDNNVYGNTFNDISKTGFYTYFGADDPWIDGGRPYDNKFYDNKMTETLVAVKLKDSDGIEVTGNDFSGAKEVEFDDAENIVWSDNSLPSGACFKSESSTFTDSSDLPEEC